MSSESSEYDGNLLESLKPMIQIQDFYFEHIILKVGAGTLGSWPSLARGGVDFYEGSVGKTAVTTQRTS